MLIFRIFSYTTPANMTKSHGWCTPLKTLLGSILDLKITQKCTPLENSLEYISGE